MKQLYRFDCREPNSSFDGYTFAAMTRHPDPMRLARRYMSWVNYMGGRPGGVDCTIYRIRVCSVGIWPYGGDEVIGHLRWDYKRQRPRKN